LRTGKRVYEARFDGLLQEQPGRAEIVSRHGLLYRGAGKEASASRNGANPAKLPRCCRNYRAVSGNHCPVSSKKRPRGFVMAPVRSASLTIVLMLACSGSAMAQMVVGPQPGQNPGTLGTQDTVPSQGLWGILDHSTR